MAMLIYIYIFLGDEHDERNNGKRDEKTHGSFAY